MPETVAVGSLFRNSAKTLGYYRGLWQNQIGDGEAFRLLFSFVEGDSTDDTWPRLTDWAAADPRVLVGRMDVEPVTSFEDRVQKWAILGNAVIDQLAGRDYDWFLWCESDLCLPPDLVLQLVQSSADVVAPAIFLGGLFYDTWGFRGLDGRRFANTAPWHPAAPPFGVMPVSSAGSVVLFRRAVIDAGVRFRGAHENGLLVGFCTDARALGFTVALDSRVSVIHPTSLWLAQQYTLGRITVEAAEGDADAAWREAVNGLMSFQHPVLGTPALPADHPVLAPVRRHLERLHPGRPFSVRTELLSENPKRYTLVITDRLQDPVPCPPVPTP